MAENFPMIPGFFKYAFASRVADIKMRRDADALNRAGGDAAYAGISSEKPDLNAGRAGIYRENGISHKRP